MMRVEQIGLATLFCGDALAVLASGAIPADCAIVSDPPYGNDFDFAKNRSRRTGLAWAAGRGGDHVNRGWSNIHGDDAPFDAAPWLAFPEVILWGGNHYAGLPSATRWLVWDKRRDTTPDNHGDAELAWTNLPGCIRVHRQLWRGVVREGEENVGNGPKLHPAQKPIALMRWCLAMTSGGSATHTWGAAPRASRPSKQAAHSSAQRSRRATSTLRAGASKTRSGRESCSITPHEVLHEAHFTQGGCYAGRSLPRARRAICRRP